MQKGYDPHSHGGQYLEDLATAYWVSDALFTALEMNLFETIQHYAPQGASLEKLAEDLSCVSKALHRYLDLLMDLGLLGEYQGVYYNSLLTKDFLLKESPLYQGDSILWRKNLKEDWKTLKSSLHAGKRVNFLPVEIDAAKMEQRREEYIKAMDNVAKFKALDCISFFNSFSGNILDVGAGSGAMALAFLEKFPQAKATLLDIKQILPHTKKILDQTPYKKSITYHACNILEKDWKLNEKQDLIILSNIVHAYAEAENRFVLKTATDLLSDDGILLIHDFFTEHASIKARLSDVNMLLNTYNGKVFSGRWVMNTLKNNGLLTTPLIPLESDTALIFAAKSPKVLERLVITASQKLISPIKNLGFDAIFEISPNTVVVSEFSKEKCKFGCRSGMAKHCQENKLSLEETKALLLGYEKAFLIKGTPPTQAFQQKILNAEKLAFKAGYHKAFALWAGPCSVCKNCPPETSCNNTKNRRPSMEGSGIDVFETVRNNGECLKPLSDKGEIVKYYALLLLA